MAKSKKGTIHVDTWGMTNHVKPKLDDAHNRMEHIYREWQRMSTPPDFGDGEELKSSIGRTIHDIEGEIGNIWTQVLAVANRVSAAETNNKNIIGSLEIGKSGKSSSKKSGKSGGKSSGLTYAETNSTTLMGVYGTSSNVYAAVGAYGATATKGKTKSKKNKKSVNLGKEFGSAVGEKIAEYKSRQIAKAKELWTINMATQKQQQGNSNVNKVGNIGSGNVSSAWGSNNGYVASGSAAVGAFGTSGVTGATNNVTTETKPPETVSNVLKLYDDDRNPLITAKTVNGKDVFYDVKTGKELTTIGAEGTEWSNETTYLQKTKELATKNGSETDYYATVDSQNGRVVLLGKIDGEWRVIKTYDSNFEAKGTITDTKSDIDISGDASNTNSTTNSQKTANNSLVGIWKIDNKKAETSTGEKYWTTYTKNGDTEGTIKQQGFYATDKSLTDYKNEENCGLNEDAAKWIYDNIPAKTTVEII